MHYLKNKYKAGRGLEKKTFRHTDFKSFVNKAPKSRFLAPTTVSVCNNGEMYCRGEEGYQSGKGIFTSGEILLRNRGIGGMLRSRNL